MYIIIDFNSWWTSKKPSLNYYGFCIPLIIIWIKQLFIKVISRYIIYYLMSKKSLLKGQTWMINNTIIWIDFYKYYLNYLYLVFFT